MKPIVAFYKALLEDMDCAVSEDGQVMFIGGKEPVPVEVGVKRDRKTVRLPLYLPLDRWLEAEEDGKRVYFHPAGESVFRGQSEVLNRLLDLANHKVYTSTVLTVDSVLALCCDTDKHAKLTQSLMEEVVGEMPNVSKSTLNSWRTILEKTITGSAGKYPLVRLQLTRDQVEGKAKGRTCTFNSPFIDSPTLYKSKVSKVGEQAIRTAFQVIFTPTSDLSLPIEAHSKAPTAPYFMALCHCFHQTMSRLARVSKLLGKHMLAKVHYTGSWVDDLDAVGDWYHNDLYFQLEGNIGVGGDVTPEQGETVRPTELPKVERAAPPAPEAPAPAKAPTPVTVKDDIPTFKPPTATPPNYGQPAPQYNAPPQYPGVPAVPPQQVEPQYPGQPQAMPTYTPPQGYPQPGYGPTPGGYPQQAYQAPQPGGFVDPRTGQYRMTGGSAPAPQGYPQGYPQPYPQQTYQAPQLCGYDAYGNPVYR